MNLSNPSEPEIPDHYANLGLPQQASFADIKRAFFMLAKKHHPDKKGPGTPADTQEFCKAREAYECLRDEEQRENYNTKYHHVEEQWIIYRQWQESQRRNEERKRADEEQRAVAERLKKEQEAAEREKAKKLKEERIAAEQKLQRERMREEKARQAEERSEEAARRAREWHEQAAKERLRREREREAEERSQEAAKKIRMEQEKAAKARLKSILIDEKQAAIRRNWAKLRETANDLEAKNTQSALDKCAHPKFGWAKKKGRANCVFCEGYCSKWSFQCPECKVTACANCRHIYCIH